MKGFFNSRIGKLLLPGIILQSVLIGGGFATGREIVEYGAKYGAMGWIGGIGIFTGFTLMAILTFEYARRFKLYDYRSFLKRLIGKAWILYDLTYLISAIIIIAVMASATGEILKTTLGFNYWLGVIIISVVVGLLNFKGIGFISRFKTFGTLALFSAYILFSILVIDADQIGRVISKSDTSFMDMPPTISLILFSGILYVGYNLGIYPASYFSVRGLGSRIDSMVAGLLSGLLMTIPWLLSYLSLLSFYPSNEVLSAPVPWLVMLQEQSRWVITIFGVVIGWTLIETATGMIHALLTRIDSSLQDLERTPLTPTSRGLLAISIIALGVILSQFGIIALVAQGYTFLAYLVIMVYAIPLITIGVFQLWKAG